MTSPDLTCEIHGPGEVSVYRRPGRTERRCLACYRARRKSRGEVKAHYGGERCMRGHLKTAWTWRRYYRRARGDYATRCLTCQYAAKKLREEQRARDRRPAAA